jgi:2-polyprenyl-3-methyl-5-hydroxy-6-metoxy-1,4-benzoquinol methylase
VRNPPLNLSLIANNVEYINDIWYSKGRSDISYPTDGNANCFQVEDNSFWFIHRNLVILDLVKNFPPRDYIFDIGGGNGFVTKSLKENGYNAFLVEPGIQGINNAQKRGISNILCSTLEDAQFREGSISAIGIFDVLEHIENDLEFLKKVSCHLEPEGILYLTVPSYKFLWSKEDDFAGHYRRYTLKSINKVLTDSGFKIKYKSYFFSFLPIPIFLFRTLPYKINSSKNPKNRTNEHSQNKGLIGSFVRFVLKKEKQRLKNLKSIAFGGSCVVVAQKQI